MGKLIVTDSNGQKQEVAAITRRASGYYIVHVGDDTGGRRGFVNGEAIAGQARRLNPGDVIELLGTQMNFVAG
ncbi:MAG: hypothetical protein QM661_04515 [Solimonas sp.]